MWLLDVFLFLLVVCYASAQNKHTLGNVSSSSESIELEGPGGIDYVSLSPSTTLYRVVEGEQLENITCSATCNPACTYAWSSSGKTVSATGTLDFGQVERREAGTYICTVHNTISRFSKNGPVLSLDVIYGPDNVSLSPSTITYILREGDQFEVITCAATCNPVCAYSWSRSGNSVSSTATLSLGQIERREAGTYICTARNPESSVTKDGLVVSVHVIHGPDKVSLSPSTTLYRVPEGNNLAAITCSATCKPACTYTWSKSGSRVSSTATLYLGQIERREAGSYLCTARNPESSVSKNGPDMRVDVIYGPDKVSLSPSTTLYRVPEGNNLAAITCSATCNPACTYTWSRSGSRVSSTATLYLRQIQPREAGSYICTVLNPESSISKNGADVRVDVIYGPDKVSLSPSTTLYTVAEGNNLASITCSATCNPDCTYAWSKSGSRVSSTATLYLRWIERREAGPYICTVLNPESSISRNGADVRVDVIYGPDNVSLSPATANYTLTEGDNLAAITCSATCYTACTYKWSISGVIVSYTATLVLSNIKRREGGSYMCTARNPQSRVSKSGTVVSVDVTYGPDNVSMSPSQTSYTMIEGRMMGAIRCLTTCNPSCAYMWSKSRRRVSSNGTLNLGEVERGEAGSYVCTARNPALGFSRRGPEVTVTVRYGPDNVSMSPSQTSYTMTEGRTMGAIRCFTTCNPSCAYMWSKSRRRVSSNGTLNLGEVERGEAGSYVCTARNPASGFSRSGPEVTVIVRYSPDVLISESSALLHENTPLDLLCKAAGIPAVYKYTGFLQRVHDIVVPNSHVGSLGERDSISVKIPSLQLQDTGVYTCYVHNGIIGHNKQLIQTASRKVEVQASPRFLVEETNFAGETSGNITISIPFISIPEYTSYSVLRHDGKLVSTNGKYTLHIRNESVYPLFYGQQVTLSGNVLEIIIRDLSEKEFGIYKMQIANDINTANFSIDVKATSKPSQPSELKLTTLDNIATLNWKQGFNGGHEQTFVLQTSLNSDESWMNKTVINESDSKYINENGRFQVHLTNLVPGIYSARLLAFNFIGAADPVGFKEQFEIKELNEGKQTSIPGALIGGTAGGGIGVIVLVIVVVVIFLRKRNTQKGQDDSDLTNGQKLENLSHRTQPEDDNIPDEVDNPMYVSGDDVDIPKATTADIYATPDKKKPKQNEGAGDIYAVVDKKTNSKNKGNITGIYGNIDNIQMTKQNNCAGDKSQKKRVNKDGLVYAEVVLANPSKGKKKLVINDIEDVTEYAQV